MSSLLDMFADDDDDVDVNSAFRWSPPSRSKVSEATSRNPPRNAGAGSANAGPCARAGRAGGALAGGARV